ncbi:hypothetical protein [Aquimarina longa]|uniref:hypothetical protein n=1 Tax=Aquimarina longa TaxID=1080221 RepID=UPI000A440C1D|nr:hypothetical protein [Aquimarina longa]
MKTLLKGEVNFVENHNNWSLAIEVKWNSRMTKTTIKSRKLDLNNDFNSCKLTQSHFLTLLSYITLSRSDSFSFYGKKSKYSDLILESPATISLMESKNAIIELKGKCLIFSGETKKKDLSSLSNIFILNEMLMKEIDELNKESMAETDKESIDKKNWTGENFEFLITGVDEIPNEDYDNIMTPNSFEWKKVTKDDWPFYKVGEDQFSFSWEIPGIQFTFNKEVRYEKAKKIADEIIENLISIGQNAELIILESNKVYKF